MPTPQQEKAAAVLLAAVYCEPAWKVAALLAQGTDPNIRIKDGVYPLDLAAARGNVDVVRLLLGHGANVELRKPNTCTVIHTACSSGHLAIVKELIKAGVKLNHRTDDNPLPLHGMARRGSIEILKELIRAGAKLDAKEVDGYMAIHYAADAGNVPALRELIRAGCRHEWRNDDNQTPLSLACFNGHLASVNYLLHEAKANPGVVDGNGHTPLATASRQGHLPVVKVLLRRGVRQLGPNAYRDALCGVAMLGNFTIMRELVSAEGGVHIKGAKYKFPPEVTPLHYTAGFCHPFAMSLLLGAGADETILDSSGKTPFDIVNTLRDEHIEHGFGRQQARRMLMQAPAYRARSWKWPDTSEAVFAGSPTAGPAKDAAKSTKGGSAASSAKVESEPAEMTAEDFDCAFNAAMSFAAAPAGAGKVDLTVYRRPAISSGGSPADGRSAVVASLIRYAQKK